MRKGLFITGIVIFAGICGTFLTWCGFARNPETPAGYVGYCTQGSMFGKADFYGMQKGPTSPGRTWMLGCVNISITPYTFTETFTAEDSVLSHDQLKLSVNMHVTFRIDEAKVQSFVEEYSTLHEGTKDPNKVVQVAYDNYLKPKLRAYVRSEVQERDWGQAVAEMLAIGTSVQEDLQTSTKDTPFVVMSVVIDSIQPPKEVADAVSQKLATDQILARKGAEVEIAKKDAAKREEEARGIAKAMEIINGKLTPMYLQHEAIEAQKLMVGSPNHTTIYIPVGAGGVPLTGTFSATDGK